VPVALGANQGILYIAGLPKGMKHIAALKELRNLHLYGTMVTDAGLAELTPLQKLEGLNLVSVKGVTDKGLRNLRALTNLRGVNAGGTRATTKGVAELQKTNPKVGVRLRDEDDNDRHPRRR
jgi:hypothetical protein